MVKNGLNPFTKRYCMKIKKKTRDKLKRVAKFFYWIVLFICVFIILGTLLHGVPLWSDIASFIFVPAYPYILILCILLAAASIIFFIRKRSTKRLITLAVSSLTLLGIITGTVFMIARVNSRGEKISFFKAFSVNTFSDIEEDNTYYTDENNEQIGLSVFYADDGKENKPVIFYTHGGGWIKGGRYDRLDTTKTFADKGYVVVSADYDLSDEYNHLYDSTEQQLLNAVSWAEKNISKYGGDINRFYMVGDSAGGNLALNLAYKINSGVYKNYPKVDAVSVIYPVTSIRDFYEASNFLTASESRKMAVSYMGSIPKKEAGRYEEHNPENYIDGATPPTMIVHGTSDASVPFKSSADFIHTLEQKGVDCELIRVPFAAHSSDTSANNFMGQAYINNTLKWFDTYK